MSQPLRRRLTVVAGVALVLVLLAAAAMVGIRWWSDRNRTDLERALAYAPPDSVRFSWTDWGGVRSELGADVDADSTPGDVVDFLDEGYAADLTSRSAMVESAPLLQERFGFSPAVVEWELFSQGSAGAVVTMGLPDSVDIDDLGDTFDELGYERPDDDSGVWTGGEELLARLATGSTISPEFTHLALDADRQLLLASDKEAYLRAAVEDVEDADDPGDEGLQSVTDAVGAPLSAAVYDGDFACTSLAMAQADDADRSAADQLVDEAGGVDPLTGFAMGSQDDGGVVVAMAFETEDQARRNADSRARLASGPAPGQGGDFDERFTLGTVTADGPVVTMQLEPTEGSAVLSDLSTGPVLFATC